MRRIRKLFIWLVEKLRLRLLAGFGIVVALATMFYGYTEQHRLRLDADDIHPALYQEPRQGPAGKPVFQLEHHGVTYQIQPMARYELWGLVVSGPHFLSWIGLDYDGGSLDANDICVIWGENVKTNDFKKLTIESGSWTCSATAPSGVTFNPYQLSNNHLIADTPDVREKIAKLTVGDQIHLKGTLINYKSENKGDGLWRRTSLTRRDMGGAAYEIIHVKNLTWLKTADRKPMELFHAGLLALGLFLLLRLMIFFKA